MRPHRIGALVKRIVPARLAGLLARVARRARLLVAGPNRFLGVTSWEYQRRVIEPALGADSVVLDVGSGPHPSPRAAILADFFPDDSCHRSSTLIENRPVVVCSVERLPFRSKSFDFVVCSHVLEHVERPKVAAAELWRVARAGYIETPAYGKDILVGTGHMHRWQVVEFEGELHFFEYSARQREAHVHSPVMECWTSPFHHPWQDYFWARQDLFNAWVLFQDRAPRVVEYRREGRQPEDLPRWGPVARERLSPDAPALTSEEIARLEQRLATPDGADPVRYSGGAFASADGRIVYPVRGKRIYCELPESARRPAAETADPSRC